LISAFGLSRFYHRHFERTGVGGGMRHRFVGAVETEGRDLKMTEVDQA
jgi:hypothetical protein